MQASSSRTADVARPILCLFTVALIGCGDSARTYPVTGTVKQADGQPLPGGTILFQPIGGQATQPARGTIAQDGSFQVGTFALADGAVPGVHKVVIMPHVPEEALDDATAVARHRAAVDLRYQNVQTTPLEVTVAEDASNNRFDLVVEPASASRR